LSITYALKIAEANIYYPKWRLGCVIKKGGAVQSVGWNSLKYDPTDVEDYTVCSLHAEIHALKQMKFKADGCTMYVARALKGGGVGLAKPCCNCQEIIESSGVKKVIFTIDTHTQGIWKP
jgi:pyrimidine deaminase RibD-like protein